MSNYNTKAEVKELMNKFFSMDADFQPHLCFNGNGGLYSLYKANASFTCELSLSRSGINGDHSLTLTMFYKDNKRQCKTLFVRSNVADYCRDVISNYWYCIQGLKEWEAVQ